MARYYVNQNTYNPGNHNEVHKEGCTWLQFIANKIDLGFHDNCQSALKAAEIHYPNNVDGCSTCCNECHKG